MYLSVTKAHDFRLFRKLALSTADIATAEISKNLPTDRNPQSQIPIEAPSDNVIKAQCYSYYKCEFILEYYANSRLIKTVLVLHSNLIHLTLSSSIYCTVVVLVM